MRPRIALIGFGMAGAGFSRALRHHRGLANTPAGFAPEVTVIEALPRVGGKVAPRNVGAQFVDETRCYPIDRMISEHRLRTHPAREDYELVDLRLRSGEVLDAEDFRGSLTVLRGELLASLTPELAPQLDKLSLPLFLDRLETRGLIDQDGVRAMRARSLLEEGRTEISALHVALAFAKADFPAQRREVVGGLHRLVEAERKALSKWGARVLLESRVLEVDARRGQVRVVWRSPDDELSMEDFDLAVLCISPEHLSSRRLKITGSTLPLHPLRALEPSRMTKSNLTLRSPVRAEEHATERYALWLSPAGRMGETVVTFFHGWAGETPLSLWEMLRVAVGKPDSARLLRFESETWDRHGDAPAAYVTVPGPEQAVPLLRLARDQYFRGRYDSGPIRVANHVLGVGGTIRDAALAGEWALISCLRALGFDVAHAWKRAGDPEQQMFGVGGAVLDALTEA